MISLLVSLQCSDERDLDCFRLPAPDSLRAIRGGWLLRAVLAVDEATGIPNRCLPEAMLKQQDTASSYNHDRARLTVKRDSVNSIPSADALRQLPP